MELTSEQRAILQGARGPILARCMRWLVEWGDAMRAKRLVPVHSTMPGGLTIQAHYFDGVGQEAVEAQFDWIQGLLAGQAVCTSTSNTGRVDLEHPELFGLSPQQVERQRALMRRAREAGVLQTWTCTPYLIGNVPLQGQICAWTESHAEVLLNSFFGARTTRHGNESAIAAAMLGLTPEFGVLLDENRRGDLLIEVQVPMRSVTDWGALGYFAGKVAGLRIPVFTGLPVPTIEAAKQICAAVAASGGVNMLHVVGVTPEAPTMEAAFGGRTPEERLVFGENELAESYASLRQVTGEEIDFVFIGCPHCTLSEIQEVANLLSGRKVAEGVLLMVATAYALEKNAERLGLVEPILAAGGHMVVDTCAAAAGAPKRRRLATNSVKQAHYTRAVLGNESYLAPVDRCIEFAVAGEAGSMSADERVILRGRGVVRGRVEGEALVAETRISFWGGFDPRTGTVTEVGSPLRGESTRGKVLVFLSTKGSSGGSGMLGLAKLLGTNPIAMINTEVDSLAALACVVHEIPLISELEGNPFQAIRTGDWVKVDGDNGVVEIWKRGGK